jgi:hypothetical protein
MMENNWPFGGKEGNVMKKKITYTDEPPGVDLDNAVVVKDFLPRPKDLVLRKERVVTLRLDDSTIAELKAEADRKDWVFQVSLGCGYGNGWKVHMHAHKLTSISAGAILPAKFAEDLHYKNRFK